MNKERLDKRLERFFFAKTAPVGGRAAHDGDRYIPRAYGDSGPGWGVYDKQQARFISDDEVWAISEETLMNSKALNA